MQLKLFWGCLGVLTLVACAGSIRTADALSGTGNARISSVPQPGIFQSGVPTPSIYRVNGQDLSGASLGPAGAVITAPGRVKLQVVCRLPRGALSGAQRPFDELPNGVGRVISGAVASIELVADVRPAREYELRCESIGDYRARAWLTEVGDMK